MEYLTSKKYHLECFLKSLDMFSFSFKKEYHEYITKSDKNFFKIDIPYEDIELDFKEVYSNNKLYSYFIEYQSNCETKRIDIENYYYELVKNINKKIEQKKIIFVNKNIHNIFLSKDISFIQNSPKEIFIESATILDIIKAYFFLKKIKNNFKIEKIKNIKISEDKIYLEM